MATTTLTPPPVPGVLGATITLRGGGYFDFLAPHLSPIRITDIAAGLANTCRFGGQCRAFYSVAQHSVLVACMVEEVEPDLAFAALMHDASEAYTGDMVKPLKLICPDFKAVEERVEAAIATTFGLPQGKMPAAIKHADLRALRTEQRDLTSGHKEDWSGLNAYAPHPDTIHPLGPVLAEVAFLAAFRRFAPPHVAASAA